MSIAKFTAIGLLCLCGATAADAASYVSTIVYRPVAYVGGDTVVIEWSTTLASGVVTRSDLTDLKFSVFGLGSLLHSDAAIISGSVQSIGGVSRDIDDLDFNFSIDNFGGNAALGFSIFSNTNTLVEEATTGETWVFFGVAPSTNSPINLNVVGIFFDGENKYWHQEAIDLTVVTTLVGAADVPLPLALAMLPMGLAGLGLVASRRRAA